MFGETEYELGDADGYINSVLNAERDLVSYLPSQHLRNAVRGARAGPSLLGVFVDMYGEDASGFPDDDPYGATLKMVEGARKDHHETGGGYGAVPVGDPPAFMDSTDAAFFAAWAGGAAAPVVATAATGDPWFLAYGAAALDAGNYLERESESIYRRIVGGDGEDEAGDRSASVRIDH